MTRLLSLAFLLVPAVVQANDSPRPSPEPIAYTFSDQLVEGDLVRPEAEILRARRRNARITLISPRSSFVNELLVSVEDL